MAPSISSPITSHPLNALNGPMVRPGLGPRGCDRDRNGSSGCEQTGLTGLVGMGTGDVRRSRRG